MNFYKHHIGDYAQATAHLSFVEDAAYSRMLRKYYAEEKPLPADVKAVVRLVGARSKEEKEAVQTVLDEFFVLEADGWHNKRCDAEITKANAQAETNRLIAEAREARKRERKEHESLHEQSTNRSPDTSGEREPSQTPDTRHQTPDTTSVATATGPGDPVKALWLSGVRLLTGAGEDEKPARSLLGKLRKDHGDTPVLEAIAMAEVEHPSNPTAWLMRTVPAMAGRMKTNGAGAPSRLKTPAPSEFEGLSL